MLASARPIVPFDTGLNITGFAIFPQLSIFIPAYREQKAVDFGGNFKLIS